MRRFLPLACFMFLLACSSLSAGVLSIYICPRDVILDKQATLQLYVHGQDSLGNSASVLNPITWSVLKSKAGSITPNGLFTAGNTYGLFIDAIQATTSNGLMLAVDVQVLPIALNDVQPVCAATIEAEEIRPMGMPIASIGGQGIAEYTLWGWRWIHYRNKPAEHKWTQLWGINTIGLLVRTWGRVKSIDESAGSFVIDDGSDVNLKCIRRGSFLLPQVNSYISVKGATGAEKLADYQYTPVFQAVELQAIQ